MTAADQASGAGAKLVAVTGTSRGIGAGIARALAAAGYTVACLSRSGGGVEDHPPAPESATRLLPFACDVTQESSIGEALRAAVAAAGPLYGLVNNAGVHADGKSESFSTEAFRKVLDTNVAGTFAVAREAYPFLCESGNSLIVNIGSYYDRVGIPRHAAYCASKAAIGAITRCLAVEWADKGIRCVDVAPGFIGTDLNSKYMANESFRNYIATRVPLGRPGSVEEVASVVTMLFDHDVRYMTGNTIYVDGAHGIAI